MRVSKPTVRPFVSYKPYSGRKGKTTWYCEKCRNSYAKWAADVSSARLRAMMNMDDDDPGYFEPYLCNACHKKYLVRSRKTAANLPDLRTLVFG